MMEDKIREILENNFYDLENEEAIKELLELFELELGLRVERLFGEAKKEIANYKSSLDQHSLDLQDLAMRVIAKDKEIAELKNQLQRCNNERIMEKARGDAFLDDFKIGGTD